MLFFAILEQTALEWKMDNVRVVLGELSVATSAGCNSKEC